MRRNLLAFALFAAALLFSMVREWAAPVACIRSGMKDQRFSLLR